MKKLKLSLITLGIFLPSVVFAEYLSGTGGIIKGIGNNIIGPLIPIVFALALLFFFWGVAQYIRTSGDAKQEGRMIMVWGVVALFVMSSIWGLVKFIGSDFLGIKESDNTTIKIPNIQK